MKNKLIPGIKSFITLESEIRSEVKDSLDRAIEKITEFPPDGYALVWIHDKEVRMFHHGGGSISETVGALERVKFDLLMSQDCI